MSTDAIGNTSTSSQTNANAMFGECLGLAYYCGPVEEWMVATNGLLIAINVVSALITLSANTLFLIVYFKTKALMSTHYFFLMLLAVTDVSVGMISQPLLIARKLMEISGVYNCALWTAMRSTVYYFSGISFLTLTLVTIERYLAVCRPIKHRNEMTRGRMARIAFAVWLAWLLFPIFRFVFLEFYKVFLLLIGGIIVAIFAINAFLYAKIRRTVLGKDPSDDVALRKVQREADLKKEARLAKTIACLMLVMILAYLPTVMAWAIKRWLVSIPPICLAIYRSQTPSSS